jgi:hypothetical protein
MSNVIKVLTIVSYNFLPPKMGGQKNIALFNEYLGQRVDYCCITTKNNDPAFADSYTVKNILSNSKFRYINPAYFFLLKKFIKDNKITHLILEQPYYGWLGILLKWFCSVKLVIHCHNIEATRFKSMGKWWWGILWHYEKLAHKNTNLSFFITEEDRDYGISKFNLNPAKCFTITYGFEMNGAPKPEEKRLAKKIICDTYAINSDERILLFNGTLDYRPNSEALDIILEKINPQLLKNPSFKYKIIICGNKLSATYDNLMAYQDKHIIFAGFVEDISIFFKGVDLFINPVIEGGGIKTKVVESLGYNLSVISTQSGAIGIPAGIAGEKLKVVEDNDWEEFIRQITITDINHSIPAKFFDHFSWNNIAEKAADLLRS